MFGIFLYFEGGRAPNIKGSGALGGEAGRDVSGEVLYVHALFRGLNRRKSKRGREEGDGTENVINCRDVCRKLS